MRIGNVNSEIFLITFKDTVEQINSGKITGQVQLKPKNLRIRLQYNYGYVKVDTELDLKEYNVFLEPYEDMIHIVIKKGGTGAQLTFFVHYNKLIFMANKVEIHEADTRFMITIY